MSADARKAAVVQHKDLVRLPDTGNALGYQEGGDAAAKAMNGAAQGGIRGKVQSAGAVVQISGFFTSARAMESRCFWPPERFRPPCSSRKSSCPSLPSTISRAWATSRACHSSSSEAFSLPQRRLSRMVPWNSTERCCTTATFRHRACWVYSFTLQPSRQTVPEAAS